MVSCFLFWSFWLCFLLTWMRDNLLGGKGTQIKGCFRRPELAEPPSKVTVTPGMARKVVVGYSGAEARRGARPRKNDTYSYLR